MSDHQVVVVGGGLAGLNAARLLAAEDVDVTVLERAENVGGRVWTERSNGFTFDRGFQVLFTAYPEAQRALDFDALDLRRFSPGAVVCRPNHRSVLSDPFRDPRGAIETVLSRTVTIGDAFRTLRIRRKLRGRSREDIFSSPDRRIDEYLVDGGFSQRFLDHFVAPLYGGITLDRTLSTSSRVFEFTFKMLAKGYAAIPAAGMAAIPGQLAKNAEEAGAGIETGVTVEAIEGQNPVSVETVSGRRTADAVIVATDPPTSRTLTGVDSIPTTGRSSVTQYFSLPTTNPLAGRKRLHLNADEPVPNTVAPLSAVAPSYAPDDRFLLSASTPGQIPEDDRDLAERTRRTLASWYPEASFEELDLLRTDRIPFAQYAQPPGIHGQLPDVTAPGGDVYLAGESTADSSINGALLSGRRAASAVLNRLQE